MIEIFRNSPIKIPFDFTTEIGQPIDITGWSVNFYCSKNLEDGQILISKSITTHIDAVNGMTEIEFTKEETSLAAGEYYYEIAVNDGIQGEYTIKVDSLIIRARVRNV